MVTKKFHRKSLKPPDRVNDTILNTPASYEVWEMYPPNVSYTESLESLESLDPNAEYLNVSYQCHSGHNGRNVYGASEKLHYSTPERNLKPKLKCLKRALLHAAHLSSVVQQRTKINTQKENFYLIPLSNPKRVFLKKYVKPPPL